MILQVTYDRRIEILSDIEVVDDVISDVFHSITSKKMKNGEYSVGDSAKFQFREPGAQYSNSYLVVAADEPSGYGAAMWWSTRQKGGIYDNVWISDNPTPPQIDPLLTADPHSGEDHDPASALPLEEIRATIREFCRSGTGERPEHITWVTGEVNGQRHDRRNPEE